MNYPDIPQGLFGKSLLVVEDDHHIRSLIAQVLESAGFTRVAFAGCAEEALAFAQDHEVDLAVLDVMLPDFDGFTLARKLRALRSEQGGDLPFMFLTARGEPEDRIEGLALGADDYLVKPFLAKELVLRLVSILRRAYPATDEVVRLAGCSVDLTRAVVVREDGDEVPLTAKEHEIVQALAERAGRIVTADALMERLWGDSFGYEQSLMTHISRLRAKLEPTPGKPVSLITVKGLGYKLVVERG